jgi:hypothetical protein
MLTTSRRACVLSTDTNGPPVPQPTMGPDFLHAFNVITELGRNGLGKDLTVLSSFVILLSIKEPKEGS